MHETFRLRPFLWHVGAGCVVVYGAIATLCLTGWVVPSDAGGSEPFLGLSGGVFCAALSALSLVSTVACWRERIVIDGRVVMHSGLFRMTTIDLAQVTKAKWLLLHGGALRLRADNKRFTISFYYLDVMT